MFKTPKELAKYLAVFKKSGVKSFKISENSVECSFQDESVVAHDAPSTKTTFEEATAEQYTPEQILFWSSQSPDAPTPPESN